ncbi:hypothetical protein BJ878DRAFT_52830 [Calycina marina]|uniref:Uncharacterized protein n=1 Tax=Calycina marina TaxID=1763456 RepID=A0A9P7Z3M6_9HELO|nr:hypothetical protein BJ878DRAFT_52830 [Calycina marina]
MRVAWKQCRSSPPPSVSITSRWTTVCIEYNNLSRYSLRLGRRCHPLRCKRGQSKRGGEETGCGCVSLLAYPCVCLRISPRYLLASSWLAWTFVLLCCGWCYHAARFTYSTPPLRSFPQSEGRWLRLFALWCSRAGVGKLIIRQTWIPEASYPASKLNEAIYSCSARPAADVCFVFPWHILAYPGQDSTGCIQSKALCLLIGDTGHNHEANHITYKGM